MHWIDIVFIAIIILFAVIGLTKGLFDSLLSLVASVGSIFLAFWASKPVAGFLNTSLNTDKFFKKFLLDNLKIPAEGMGGHTVNELAKICTIVLSMLIVYLLIKATIWLLSRLFDSVSANSTALSGLNRLFGLVFGAARGFAIILIGLGLTAIVAVPETKINQNINDFFAKSNITRHVYNYVDEWVENDLQNVIDDFVNDLLKGTEDTKPETKPETEEDKKKAAIAKAATDLTLEKVVNSTDVTVTLKNDLEVDTYHITVGYSEWQLLAKDGSVIKSQADETLENFVKFTGLTASTEYKITYKVTLKIKDDNLKPLVIMDEIPFTTVAAPVVEETITVFNPVFA